MTTQRTLLRELASVGVAGPKVDLAVRAAFPADGAEVVPVADIIGPGEIRAIAGGVTRATFRHWRAGRNTRGAGPFPPPFKTVSGVELFDRRAVCAWLEHHQP